MVLLKNLQRKNIKKFLLIKMSKRLTNKEFIEKVKEIHSDEYDYYLAEYNGYDIKTKIICHHKGVFGKERGFFCKHPICI